MFFVSYEEGKPSLRGKCEQTWEMIRALLSLGSVGLGKYGCSGDWKVMRPQSNIYCTYLDIYDETMVVVLVWIW